MYFSNGDEISGYFSHRGAPGTNFGPFFPVGRGSHRVCDTGVFSKVVVEVIVGKIFFRRQLSHYQADLLYLPSILDYYKNPKNEFTDSQFHSDC